MRACWLLARHQPKRKALAHQPPHIIMATCNRPRSTVLGDCTAKSPDAVASSEPFFNVSSPAPCVAHGVPAKLPLLLLRPSPVSEEAEPRRGRLAAASRDATAEPKGFMMAYAQGRANVICKCLDLQLWSQKLIYPRVGVGIGGVNALLPLACSFTRRP